ncbi:MAG: RND transporter [Bacteroidetes bacterium]|jgi:HlyD family secretion protein|nr:RND transporter [Bacteroidota bacterium]MBT6686551.1 RND transporter [Bacteroidota bacterium]MBT7142914.1 RND transporter [Bacteroidota bacterium]MBT7490637.1 RND transporter [Bacteroidota bacterium]
MKTKYWIFIAVIIVAIIAMSIFSSSGTEGIEIIKTKVSYGEFEVVVMTTGELKAENSEKIRGPSRLRNNGIYNVQITDLIPEGTVVDSGDYVATLDRTEGTNRLNNLNDEIQKIEAQYIKTQLDTTLQLRNARDELINMNYSLEERQIELEQSKYETPATIRQAKISLDKAERAYSQAKKNYEIKKKQADANMVEVSATKSKKQRELDNLLKILDEFEIKAPKSGMVIYRKEWGGAKRKVGSKISAWDPVVATLPDLSAMISKTYVNEIDISKIEIDQAVEIGVDAFPEKKYTGIIFDKANIGEQLPNSDSKVFEILIRVNEYDSILRPAMTTNNAILTAKFEDVLYIPLEAVHTNDSLSFVIKENGFSPTKQIVELGEFNENEIIVNKGIAKDEVILLSTPENVEELQFEGLEIFEEIKKKEALKKKLNEERQKERKDSLKKKKKVPLDLEQKISITIN